MVTCNRASTTPNMSPRPVPPTPPAGQKAGLSFSPRYAAPETLRAFEAREREVLVDSAVDMWALGVMAYELLTDGPAFDMHCGQQDIIDRLVGRKPLPWEEGGGDGGALRKLRMLQRSLTKCLAREPSERPSAAELLVAWNKMFDNIAGEQTVQV